MGGACYTCDYVIRQQNEITGEYLYFCKKIRKSVLWNWRCKLYKHEIKTLKDYCEQRATSGDTVTINELKRKFDIP
jgi:hypothetical protein